MADGTTVEYVITIKGDGSSGGKGNKSGGVASTVTGENASGLGRTLKDISGAVTSVGAMAAANKIVTTVLNRVSVTTGQATLQERLNFQYDVTKRVISTGIALIGGAASGNYLAVGAAVASIVSTGVDIAITQMNINTERRVESIGIRQANIRAGASGDRSGKSGY